MYDLDALALIPDATVKLTHQDTGKLFKSFISEDLSLSASATYSSPFEDYLAQKQDSLSKLTSAISLAGWQLPKVPMKVIGNSAMNWQSSERPTFSVPMTFITTDDQSNTQQKATALASYCYPRSSGKELSDFINPPGGFMITDSGATGLWVLEIGDWFRATDLILTASPPTFSKERTPYGPVWATVACQLAPFLAPTEEVFLGYFKV